MLRISYWGCRGSEKYQRRDQECRLRTMSDEWRHKTSRLYSLHSQKGAVKRTVAVHAFHIGGDALPPVLPVPGVTDAVVLLLLSSQADRNVTAAIVNIRITLCMFCVPLRHLDYRGLRAVLSGSKERECRKSEVNEQIFSQAKKVPARGGDKRGRTNAPGGIWLLNGGREFPGACRPRACRQEVCLPGPRRYLRPPHHDAPQTSRGHLVPTIRKPSARLPVVRGGPFFGLLSVSSCAKAVPAISVVANSAMIIRVISISVRSLSGGSVEYEKETGSDSG